MSPREALQRSLVVDEARSWIGTPYHHMADVKGVGVDCAMILVRCFVDTGLTPPFDPRPYSHDWHLHRSEEKYLTHMESISQQVMVPQPGDFVVWRWGRTFSHGALVTDWNKLHVIQALAKERLVLEGPPPDYLEGREMKFYSFWEGRQ